MTWLSVLSDDLDIRWRALRSRVWLDGVEVTRDCQIADDVAGHVLLLVRDADGCAILNEYHELETEWREGDVRIETAPSEPAEAIPPHVKLARGGLEIP
jgi:hypothetical protein